MTDASFPPSGGAPRAPPPPLTTATTTATTASTASTTAFYSSSSSSSGPPSISSIPRRSSYASVLSGTAALSPPSTSHLSHSHSPFAHLIPSHSTASQPPPSFSPDARLLRPSIAVDAEMQMNSPWRPSAGDPLPAYSRKFASVPRYDPFLHSPGSCSDPAAAPFTPSYLRNSRYVSRLDAARRAKLAAHRDGPVPSSSTTTTTTTTHPLSTSSSQASLPRIAPSHRGMTYDIIEREPPGDDDNLLPLPSRWNDDDKYSGLELTNGGLEVRYTGPVNKHDHEAAAVRADNPMPPQCGIYYFEITILSKPKEGMIGIGFSSKKASVERLPGWEQESWAYHGDDGKSFFGESQGQGRQYGPTFGANDTVGCGVNFSTGCAFFTKNGIFLGNAFRELRNLKVYPSVGMKKQPPVHLAVNFGQQPFMFDIDDMVKKEKSLIHGEIGLTSTANLQPPLDETGLLQELVAQFLAHDGYVETARAFAEEVAAESTALENGRQAPLKKYEVEEDVEAINRQKIRAAILDGDIDKALKYTNAYYANVLQTYPQILFKLRCRKFLEMMRRCNEPSTSGSKRKASNGLSDGSAVFDQEMELDERLPEGEGWGTEGMDMEELESTARSNALLTEAVQYGQQMFVDYPPDDRNGYHQTLENIFSLVAYQDARQSVHGHYLDPAGRIAVAEELNSAILVSLGKSSSAALERLYQQTEVLVNEISEEGGAGAFINVRNDFLL
ncbi:Ran-binding protein [Aspergillus ellipticus CBS 707.79]|uniref:Protein FYV10 n=1 Tax=Aspergillus ellipticus CBS 707.79 TaxID=1448320 RepID=A0A319D058_9EURO|nr:Ran-binding protein [Aspergillus ellipticus CBS 707.79]